MIRHLGAFALVLAMVRPAAAQVHHVNPAGVPTPAARFTQAVGVDLPGGRLLFISGQVALDSSGALVGRADAAAQARQTFENLRRILAAHGGTFDDVLKLTIFVVDSAAGGAVGPVRNQFLGAKAPASTFVQVSRLFNPEWLVEVEAVAWVRR